LKILIFFIKKCKKLWKIFDVGLVGVSQNFYILILVCRGSKRLDNTELEDTKKIFFITLEIQKTVGN
jgi:hypothetical protein